MTRDAHTSRIDLYAAIRRDAKAGLSKRALQRAHGVGYRTVAAAVESAWPKEPKPPPKRGSRLDRFREVIDGWLRDDLDAPRKQRHTAKRIFDRLLDKHDAAGLVSYGMVREYVAVRRREIRIEAGREPANTFIPQEHLPGREAEVDFGEVAIDQACRMLRMPTIRSAFTDYADRAGHEQMSYRGFLAELLLAECDDRARRRSERRIKAAKFPRQKSLCSFDFEANPNIDPAVVHTLAKCEWVQKGQPLCLIGDSGTGKSHLLIALGTEAAMAGYRVKYTLATQLANELVEAADEMTLAKTIARYGRVDLLCIDELGYMQLARRGAELLFQVLTEREEKASVGCCCKVGAVERPA